LASLAPFQWFSVIVIPLPAMLVLQALLVDLIFSKRFYIAQPIEIDDVAFVRILKHRRIRR